MNKTENINLIKGDEAYKQIKKYLNTTLFRWKPDYEQAARFSREAIKYYKLANAIYKLMVVYQYSGISHEHIQSYHTAATAYEHLAKLYYEQNDIDNAVKYYKLSAKNYYLNESFDKYSSMLLKACDILSQTNIEDTIKLLKDACNSYINEFRPEMHELTYKRAITLCIIHKKYNEAINFLRSQIILQIQRKDIFEQDIYKNILSIIIIYLYSDQLINAIIEHKKQEKTLNYLNSESFYAAADLLLSYQHGDVLNLSECIKKHNIFKYLYIPVGRLLKHLKLTPEQIKDGIQRFNKFKSEIKNNSISDDNSDDDNDNDNDDNNIVNLQ